MSMLRIKDYLDQNEESIRKLSKGIGKSRATVCKMLDPDDHYDPKLSTLLAVANYLNCKVENLISENAYLKEGEDYEIY